MEPILSIRDLRTYFHSDRGLMPSVDGVDLELYPGQVLGLVGESGCGKTVLSLSIMGMVTYPGEVESGQILFRGKDLLKLDEEGLQTVRGPGVGMIFQDPLTSLNPVFQLKSRWSHP